VAGDVAIVRLEVHVGAIFNRNVLAYASDTQLIWSIPKPSSSLYSVAIKMDVLQ